MIAATDVLRLLPDDLRLGLSGHAFKGWDPDELLESARRRWGIELLDYWPWNRGSLSVREYRALLRQRRVEVYAVNAPSDQGRLCDPTTTEAGARALFAAIDDALAFGATNVQFYTGAPATPDAETAVKVLIHQLEPALEKAEREGVTLLLENNLDQRGEDPAQVNPSRLPDVILSVLETAQSEILKVCFDPCNFYTVGASSWLYAYELLREHITNVHIKDCVTYSPLQHEDADNKDHLLIDSSGGAFLPVPVGDGAVNWGAILGRLAADGYGGGLTLDPFSAPASVVAWCDSSIEFLSEYQAVPHDNRVRVKEQPVGEGRCG